MEAAAQTLSGAAAVGACAAMALLYVGILYSPTVLRLPPPTTLDSFLIRRFVCAAVASTVSVVACAVLLGIRNFEAIPSIFGILGMRVDHWGRALVFALLLTSLPYAGSLVSKLVAFVHVQNEAETSSRQGEVSEMEARGILDSIHEVAANILTWRNYVVIAVVVVKMRSRCFMCGSLQHYNSGSGDTAQAPLTEEIVFRACMIPLLLCGGFKTSTVIFCSPIFFSLAHLNHFLELYCQRRYTFLKVFTIVGLQLGYTVIFGWYASFLFIRTGNLICPIVAHIFCNVMGLPVLSSSHAKGLTLIASVVGLLSFFLLLFPITRPDLYNETVDNCRCWHRYCHWD